MRRFAFSENLIGSARLALTALLLPFVVIAGIGLQAQAGVSPAGNPLSAEGQYADDLSQSITLQPRININRASMHQLRLLPGFDNDLALKVMRSRPFSNINDFYQKMPQPCLKRLGYVRSRLQLVVSFH